MAEERVSGEQEAPRLPNTSKRLGFLFAFGCINASVVIFTIVMFLRKDSEDCPECKKRSPMLVTMLTILATLLFFLGVSILSSLFIKRKHSSTLIPQVVVSPIPAEDLEKSPAPMLPYNHIPFVGSSPIHLPDYFTAVQNTGECYSSVDADVWTEGVPEIRPPCYEQALEMATSTSSAAEYT